MLILVCGDRHWTDRPAITLALAPYHGSTVLHGDAHGADRIAGMAAVSLGMDVIAVPAEWSKYGRSAGPIRNRKMLDMKPDLVLAFHDDLERSKGTKDCVTEAQRRGILVRVYPEEHP